MSAARNASAKALKQLAAGGQQMRKLHMTGTDTYPATMAATSKTTMSKPIVASKPETATPASTRTFNTSRALKAPKDTSTIDFAFLPSFPIPEDANMSPQMRIPLLHSNFDPERTGPLGKLSDEPMPVHRPIIMTASSTTTHISAPSAMSELQDHTGLPDLPDAAIAVTQAVQAETRAATGLVREVWTGFLDDVFGAKQRVAHA